MNQENIRFWNSIETARPVTVEVISEVVTPQDAFYFADGLNQIFQTAKAIKPDVVFLPERGSAPFGWALDYFGSREGISFKQVPMIIGAGTNVLTGEIGGQTKPNKQKNVERAVEIATELVGNIKNPLLIDEVQYGGTIRQASHYLHVFLEAAGINVPLNLIAVEDSKKGGWDTKKAKGYKILVSNRRPYIRSTVLRMPLFTIDRDELLNRLLVEPHVSQTQQLSIVMHDRLVTQAEKPGFQPMPMVMHNISARNTIQTLLAQYSEPDEDQDADSDWMKEYKRICRKLKAA